MFRIVTRFLDRVFGVTGAFCFAQFPQFLDVYKQRLSGHLAELNLQVQQLKASSNLTGKSVDEYIAGFLNNPDIAYAQQGKVMQQMLERWKDLTEASLTLQNANAYTRPLAFLSDLQIDVAKGVIQEFQPGLSFTVESGVYALFGIVFGTAFFFLVRSFFSSCGRLCVRGAKTAFRLNQIPRKKR